MVDARAFDLLHSDESSSAADLREMFKAVRSVAQPRRAGRAAAAPSRRGRRPCRPPPRRARESRGRRSAAARAAAAERAAAADGRAALVGRAAAATRAARSSSGEHLVVSRPARGAPPAVTAVGDAADDDGGPMLYCVCQRPDGDDEADDDPFIRCFAGRSGCNGWVHLSCAVRDGLSEEDAEAVVLEDKEVEGYVCSRCAAAGFVAVSASKGRAARAAARAGSTAAAGDDGAPPRLAKRAATATNHRGNLLKKLKTIRSK